MSKPPRTGASASVPLPPLKALPLALAFAFGGQMAWGATFTVGAAGDGTVTTGCASAGNATCTLRGALSLAADGDTLVFRAGLSGQTITFTSDDAASVGVFPGPTALVVDGKSVILDASSLAQPINLSGNGARRLFHVTADGGLTLRNLVLSDGLAQGQAGGSGSGGGGGSGGLGGAILSEGMLTLEGVTLSSNTAAGGAGGDGLATSTIGGGGGGGTAGNGGSTASGSAGSGGAGGGGDGGSSTGIVGTNGTAGGFGGGGGGGGGGSGATGGGGLGGFAGGGGGGGGGEVGLSGGGGWGAGAGGVSGGGGGGAAGLGAALFVKGGSAVLRNVSFSGNTAQGGAAGAGAAATPGGAYGGGVFVCTATEGGADCAGTIDEAASCGTSFGGNAAASGQADLFWSAAGPGAHDPAGLTDACAVASSSVSAVPSLSAGALSLLTLLLAGQGRRAVRRQPASTRRRNAAISGTPPESP